MWPSPRFPSAALCVTVIQYHKQDLTPTLSIDLFCIPQFMCSWVCVFTCVLFYHVWIHGAPQSGCRAVSSQGSPLLPFYSTTTHYVPLRGMGAVEGWQPHSWGQDEVSEPLKVLLCLLVK